MGIISAIVGSRLSVKGISVKLSRVEGISHYQKPLSRMAFCNGYFAFLLPLTFDSSRNSAQFPTFLPKFSGLAQLLNDGEAVRMHHQNVTSDGFYTASMFLFMAPSCSVLFLMPPGNNSFSMVWR